MTTVNWDDVQWVIKSGRRRRHYAAYCHSCGQIRWLTAHDARKAEAEGRSCGSCQRQRIAPLGYQGLVRVAGQANVLRKLALYLSEHLTQPERIVRDWLLTLQVPFTCQHLVVIHDRYYILDFHLNLPGGELAIECDGDYWHSLPQRRARDQRLIEQWPGRLLRLSESQIIRQPEITRSTLYQIICQLNQQGTHHV